MNKVYELTDNLIKLYNEYVKENYSLPAIRPVSELDNFLDTLKGSVAFRLTETSRTYGDTQNYFSYFDEEESVLNFYSNGFIIDDINRNEDFIKHLIKIDYFEKER